MIGWIWNNKNALIKMVSAYAPLFHDNVCEGRAGEWDSERIVAA